jgi:hypothetical protein
MNSFHIGQVVVCVDASKHPTAGDVGEYPVEGDVYTIRSFSVINPIYDFEGEGIGEVAFLSYRFRPAKKTSLDVFEVALKERPLHLEEV